MSPDEANSSPAGDPTIRSNIVLLIDYSATINAVTVAPGTWMVSAGQPSNPPPIVAVMLDAPQGSNGFSIEFDAGRDGTSAVANAFNDVCGGAAHEYCTTVGFPGGPGDLNFLFGLELHLQSGTNSSIVPVFLGQGSNGLQNNWWIGGACVSSSGSLTAPVATLRIQGSGTNVFVFHLNSSSNNNSD